MEHGEKSSAPNGNENEYNEPNGQFWSSIKSYYLLHPEDELALVLVENGNSNPYLQLTD